MGKKIFRKLHLWLSVPFGILIALICFSGAMLVFEDEVTQWVKPHLYRVSEPSGTRISTEEAAALVAATLPEGVEVRGVKAFPAADRTYQVSLTKPKRAAVLGRYERLPFFQTMFRLHRWLLGSRPADGGIYWGKLLVGVSTLLFVFVLLSGVVIWWPRTWRGLRNSLKIVTRRGWPRFWYGFHVAGGMYVLFLLLLMALTGLTWSFGWYREWVYGLLGADARPLVKALHIGTWGGMTTRILYFLAALLGASLPLTGYYLWIRKLRRK